MALQKMPPLLVTVALLTITLTACGGQPLSKREIARAVFFEKQGANYSVCLLLADQSAPASDETPAFKTASAAASTPAQALEAAAASLPGDVYYGLLDAAALPAAATWADAQEIGLLLYDRTQPAPELSVFLLDGAAHDWRQDAQSLYESMQATEDRYKLHCGLQQLFTQQNACAVPALSCTDAYDFVLLSKDTSPRRCRGMAAAQLAAILAGQTTRLQGTFANNTAACTARADLTADGSTFQLHLYSADLRALSGTADEETLRRTLETELQASFQALTQVKGAEELFHFTFWQQCLYGPNTPYQTPKLNILWE